MFAFILIFKKSSLNNSLFSDIQNSASRQSMRQPVDQGEFKTIDEVLTCSNKIQSQCQDNEVKYIKYCTYYLNRFHCLHFPHFLFTDIRRRTSTQSMSQRFARSDSAAYSKSSVGVSALAF